jgi:hypothetical protein
MLSDEHSQGRAGGRGRGREGEGEGRERRREGGEGGGGVGTPPLYLTQSGGSTDLREGEHCTLNNPKKIVKVKNDLPISSANFFFWRT